MIEMIYYEVANQIYSVAMQLLTAYFFFRFCRIFMSHKHLLTVSIFYLVALVVIGFSFGEISNFQLYLAASCMAFLLLLPLKCGTIYVKLLVVITYFSIRWMAPTIVLIVYRPINALSSNVLERYFIPNIENISLSYYIYTVLMMLVMLCLYSLALWLVLFIYQKCIHYNERNLTNREVLILILPALIGMSSYFMMNKYHRIIEQDAQLNLIDQLLLFWGIHNLVTFIAMFAVLVLIQKLDVKRKEQQKNALLVAQSSQIQQHLESIDSLYKDMQMMKHDVNNHLSTVERLMEKKQFDEATLYLESMQQHAGEKLTASVTGNPIVDVLIQEKMKLASKNKSSIQSHLVYPQFIDCDVYDLCILLHNALDNALSATAAIPDAVIELTSLQHKTTYLITVKNPLNKADDSLVQQKRTTGFGLQIIRDVAAKYNGDVNIVGTNDNFELTILLHFTADR